MWAQTLYGKNPETGVKYLHSATSCSENIRAWNKKLWALKYEKVGRFYVPTCPVFADLAQSHILYNFPHLTD